MHKAPQTPIELQGDAYKLDAYNADWIDACPVDKMPAIRTTCSLCGWHIRNTVDTILVRMMY